MSVLRLIGASVIFASAFCFFACSADSASGPPGGTGGGSGTGGGASQGGPLTPADATITGTVVQCPGTTPKELPNMTVSECVIAGCSQAACVPGNLVQQFAPTTDLSLLATCGDPSVYCVPIDYIATTGDFQTKTCTSVAGAEGRCISTCVPQVAERIDQLPVDTCNPQTERCAPCFDPTKNGADTKACSQGCDTGPTQPAVTFAECGSGGGLCVPQDLVPADLRAAVPVADCTQAGYVCAPKLKVADLDANFTACVPSSMVLQQLMPPDGPNGQKGACVPKYLVDAINPPPDTVLQDTCMAGELCAPCSNPLMNNAPTGACPTM